MKELLHDVRPLGLASADSIMDAISLKVESRDMELPHRGFIYPDKNVSTLAEGAQVIEGESAQFLLENQGMARILEKKYHFIDEDFNPHRI